VSGSAPGAGTAAARSGRPVRPKRALSQNFLVDPSVLETIIVEAAVEPGRRVLEIGPGLGALTAALLEAGAAVTAVELDRRLVERLRERFGPALRLARRRPGAPGGLVLVEGDVLDVDLAAVVEPPFDVVANLPYHITSPILHRLLGEAPQPERLVLMVQREVAERIAASPGSMSYLSVFVQYHARVRIARLVPPEAFEPAPEVWSAILVLEVRPASERLEPAAEDELWRLVQAGFRERRKMLRNVLARNLPVDAARIAAALEAAGIDADRRPQTLSVADWLALRAALSPIWRPRPARRREAPDEEPARRGTLPSAEAARS
jgi:16S rRNA (adenine1518-N6/adenine1519-N6)-dimethyltransferase